MKTLEGAGETASSMACGIKMLVMLITKQGECLFYKKMEELTEKKKVVCSNSVHLIIIVHPVLSYPLQGFN